MSSHSTCITPTRQARVPKLNTIIENDIAMYEEEEPRGRSRISRAVSPVPSSTSTISSYYQSVRYSSDYNDLYDVSDDEEEIKAARPKLQIRPASNQSDTSSIRDSWITDATQTATSSRYPSMVIPSPRHWPTIQKFQENAALPLSPGSLIPISPLALSLLNAPPAPARTPSLDGSLTSDQTATASIPSTPDIERNPASMVDWDKFRLATSGCESEYDGESDCCKSPTIAIGGNLSGGVQLPADALDVLKHLSIEAPETPAVEKEHSQMEMIEVPVSLFQPSVKEICPPSATSEYSISRLSIPSPGGFLASLDTGSRSTWTLPAEPTSAPPSSSTAEHFYSAPWNWPLETAKQHAVETRDATSTAPVTVVSEPITTGPIVEEITLGKDFDDSYQFDLKQTACESNDRTSSWLSAQTTYMEDITLAMLTDAKSSSIGLKVGRPSLHAPGHFLPTSKKTVKFVNTELANTEYKKGPSSAGSESLFYQAFQHMSNQSSPTDSFIHRKSRYDSLQARRASVSSSHVDNIIGKFRAPEIDRPMPSRPISMMPGHEEEVTHEQRLYAQVEREREALEQVAPSMWVVEALRFLSGGRLLNSPVSDVLVNATAAPNTRTDHANYSQASPADGIRVLDLGGQPSCDWAWHCALTYPHVRTYTATCDPRITPSNLHGPQNHRLVHVDQLWRLPFPENHFDAISARSLFAHLRTSKPDGQSADQIDCCLKECLRVLKPGGYLEYFVLDAEVVRGGPRGTAASVEFGFKLRSRGYDPSPTKSWLGRVRRAGFVDIKRAWMFLPMGALRQQEAGMPETPPPRASMFVERIKGAEAVQGQVGSADGVAEVSGLLGSWMWEQWLVKLECEMGKAGVGMEGLGQGVGAVVDEGRKTGAGWRCLSGWARKE